MERRCKSPADGWRFTTYLKGDNFTHFDSTEYKSPADGWRFGLARILFSEFHTSYGNIVKNKDSRRACILHPSSSYFALGQIHSSWQPQGWLVPPPVADAKQFCQDYAVYTSCSEGNIHVQGRLLALLHQCRGTWRARPTRLPLAVCLMDAWYNNSILWQYLRNVATLWLQISFIA